jgi:hypothetical protein
LNKYIIVATDLKCTKIIAAYIIDAENEEDAKLNAEISLPIDEKYKLYVILPKIENTPAE